VRSDGRRAPIWRRQSEAHRRGRIGRQTRARHSSCPARSIRTISSLALHRHARHRALHQEALSVSPFRSPEADFSAPGSMPPGTPQSLSSTEPVFRNGLSLARNGCSLSVASIPGSKVPACYFKTPPAGFAARSAFGSPASAGLPQSRAASSLQARCVSTRRLAGCFLRLHSPPGLLPPSGSECSTDSAALRPAFRTRPISFRSPPPFLFLGLAADHRSWIATFPETRCSSNARRAA